MQYQHPSHHHFACVTLSNLIKRVVFKHHLAQLLREVRVAGEEPRLGKPWSWGIHQGSSRGGKGAAPTIPKAWTQLKNCSQPGTFLPERAKEKFNRPRVVCYKVENPLCIHA